MHDRLVSQRIAALLQCFLASFVLLYVESPGFSETSPDMRVIKRTTSEKCRLRMLDMAKVTTVLSTQRAKLHYENMPIRIY